MVLIFDKNIDKEILQMIFDRNRKVIGLIISIKYSIILRILTFQNFSGLKICILFYGSFAVLEKYHNI